ncbi:MAG: hypothetical protein JWQ63_902 [Mucilaginibacter sp.]|nr:hypothetical protein [Mucilaginibacter sp.]
MIGSTRDAMHRVSTILTNLNNENIRCRRDAVHRVSTTITEFIMKILTIALLFYVLCINNETISKKNNNTVQFNISTILNARPVTIVSNNKLITWTKGIDGNGVGDGYLTLSAALFNGDKALHALPDDPLFPANNSHPEIKLHYSNKDSLQNQTCNIAGEGEVEFSVSQIKYKDVYLALTSSEGASLLQVRFKYTDGTEVENFVLPDYYLDIKADDPNLCYLVHDLAKWGNKNNMTEKDHHNIDLLNIHPDQARRLKSISISKTKPGYLVFWAAAGVKTR